jgi:hypothetical protein
MLSAARANISRRRCRRGTGVEWTGRPTGRGAGQFGSAGAAATAMAGRRAAGNARRACASRAAATGRCFAAAWRVLAPAGERPRQRAAGATWRRAARGGRCRRCSAGGAAARSARACGRACLREGRIRRDDSGRCVGGGWKMPAARVRGVESRRAGRRRAPITACARAIRRVRAWELAARHRDHAFASCAGAAARSRCSTSSPGDAERRARANERRRG